MAYIAALNYKGEKNGGLALDYTSALSTAEDLGLGLVSSQLEHEV